MIGVASKVCPNYSTVWVQNSDGATWNNDEPFMGEWHNRYPEDPLPTGSTYCPVCAVASASHADHMAFIRENAREKDFLAWLLRDATNEDLVAMFEALSEELMEVRATEYADENRKAFMAWRCGL